MAAISLRDFVTQVWGSDEVWAADHVIPLSGGGRHCRSNVQWTCPGCNRFKGSLAVAELFETPQAGQVKG
jgi:5-methylcytosine-specific restriction endonuclease McrA